MSAKQNKTDSLLFRIGAIFFIFMFVMLVLSGISTYLNQTAIYQSQNRERLQQIADHLASLIERNDRNFSDYQGYFLEHADEMVIPRDFSDHRPAQQKFEAMIAEDHPGQSYGYDLFFADLSEEEKKAFAVWQHEYWLLTFEGAVSSFGVAYTYYLVPLDESSQVCWMLDATRELREGTENELDLGIVAPNVREKYPTMWEAWDTGKKPSGYHVYDNEYGKTYAYYVPAFLEGRKSGIVGVEVEIANVNHDILMNTFRQVLWQTVILVLGISGMLFFLNRYYISRMNHLSLDVRQYTQNKDPKIVVDIEREAINSDEISSLANQTAAMILELDNYMKSLVDTTKELAETKEHANQMNVLAFRDALTGIRNKAAYDKEVARLEWQIAEDDQHTEFGIGMVDLNFLKRINDTYGHEQGNAAIKKTCMLVCHTFQHSPVFRIGGDEFVVILEHGDYENREALVRQFNEELEKFRADEELEPWEAISASIGIAVYDPKMDRGVDNVFKRADKAMYLRKKEMKAVRTD